MASSSDMIRNFCYNVATLHGSFFLLVALQLNIGQKFSETIKGLMEDPDSEMEEYRRLAASSNVGSMVVLGKIENCFVLLSAVSLVCIGIYIPVEQRGIPSLAIAMATLYLFYIEYSMTNNQFEDFQLYQGKFMEVLEIFTVLNGMFGVLHTVVAVSILLGFCPPEQGRSRNIYR